MIMNFFTISTFRQSVASLLKKRKDGYNSVVQDICDALNEMPDDIIRESNDRVYQYPEYRVVKLRLPNSGLRLSKANGCRLIYWVSLKHDNVALLRVYPKRGSQGIVDLTQSEYRRLQLELFNQSQANMLHQVDITNALSELSTSATLSAIAVK